MALGAGKRQPRPVTRMHDQQRNPDVSGLHQQPLTPCGFRDPGCLEGNRGSQFSGAVRSAAIGCRARIRREGDSADLGGDRSRG